MGSLNMLLCILLMTENVESHNKSGSKRIVYFKLAIPFCCYAHNQVLGVYQEFLSPQTSAWLKRKRVQLSSFRDEKRERNCSLYSRRSQLASWLSQCPIRLTFFSRPRESLKYSFHTIDISFLMWPQHIAKPALASERAIKREVCTIIVMVLRSALNISTFLGRQSRCVRYQSPANDKGMKEMDGLS